MNRTQLAVTSMACNTPLQTEAVLRKYDPLILKERTPKCSKQRAMKVILTAVNANLLILDPTAARFWTVYLFLSACHPVPTTGHLGNNE